MDAFDIVFSVIGKVAVAAALLGLILAGTGVLGTGIEKMDDERL